MVRIMEGDGEGWWGGGGVITYTLFLFNLEWYYVHIKRFAFKFVYI